ncbi:MAG: hypothetical protein OHK0046_09160 [Anaerolineae bacterium]
MARRIEDGIYRTHIQSRHARGQRMRAFYFASLIVALVALVALFYNIVNQAAGLVATDYQVQPEEVLPEGVALGDLTAEQSAALLVENAERQLLVITRDELSQVPESDFTRLPLSEAIRGEVPEELREKTVTQLTPEEYAIILSTNVSADALREEVETQVLKPITQESWTLTESLFNRGEIERTVEDEYPTADLGWRVWVNPEFISDPLSSVPADTGIRPAILGTLWLLLITILVAFPLGLGAAIYLQEYANDSLLNRIIELNIRNLAGVPSIIYGMLGLAIFARALESITQGRTILSAGLTMALLILPIMIISSQEALRAVPNSLREASYGLGATKWQTISRQVLPAALPGILTGTILAMSRAIGETAPLIVVGAATFINVDPEGPFARFTALPILIFNWTTQPNDQFRNAAAAGIIVLLVVLLAMNATAIYLRNRASRRTV